MSLQLFQLKVRDRGVSHRCESSSLSPQSCLVLSEPDPSSGSCSSLSNCHDIYTPPRTYTRISYVSLTIKATVKNPWKDPHWMLQKRSLMSGRLSQPPPFVSQVISILTPGPRNVTHHISNTISAFHEAFRTIVQTNIVERLMKYTTIKFTGGTRTKWSRCGWKNHSSSVLSDICYSSSRENTFRWIFEHAGPQIGLSSRVVIT